MAVKRYQDKLQLERRKKFAIKIAFIAGGVFILLGSIFYCLFFARIFDIRGLNIDVPQSVAKESIEEVINDWLDSKVFFIKRRNNSIFFNPSNLLPIIAGAFPEIEQINISKNNSHEINLSATLRQPSGIWCFTQKSECFFYDSRGVIYSKTQSAEGSILARIDDNRHMELKAGDILDDQWLLTIHQAKELLIQSKISITSISIPENSLEEFDVKTSSGYQIYMSKDHSIDQQVTALTLTLKQKISKDQLATLAYIDLRIPGRVYYK